MRSYSNLLKVCILLAVVLSGLLLPACGEPTETGILEGTVKIGPIWPVERPGENPPVPSEVFASRKIMVYNRSSTKLVEQVDIIQIDQRQEGHYRVELQPGIYTVDTNHLGIDHSADVPKQIEIKSGQTVRVDIDIDTGIR